MERAGHCQHHAILRKKILENRIDKWSDNSALSKYQKRSHQNNSDNEGRKPILLADLEKVPYIFEEIE